MNVEQIAERIGATVLAVALACVLACCGGGSDPARVATVIHVGDADISNATVAHWMTVLSASHVLPVPPAFKACIAHRRAAGFQSSGGELRQACLLEYRTVRHRALAYLITARWTIGEAAAQGVAPTRPEVQRQLAARQAAYGGAAEYAEALRAIGHTAADVRLEVEAQRAGERLRATLAAREPKVTPADVADYYRAHPARYAIPEERWFDIGENFPTAAAARKVMREASGGRPLPSLHEKLPRKPYTDYNGEKRKIYEAIFKAAPNALVGPVRLNNLYFVVRVTRIRPAYVESLAHAHNAIARQLAAERRRRTLASFVAAWRSRWTARTDCAAGYVVQKCRQYTGAKAPEEPLSFS